MTRVDVCPWYTTGLDAIEGASNAGPEGLGAGLGGETVMAEEPGVVVEALAPPGETG